jgi:hypothetical protein
MPPNGAASPENDTLVEAGNGVSDSFGGAADPADVALSNTGETGFSLDRRLSSQIVVVG